MKVFFLYECLRFNCVIVLKIIFCGKKKKFLSTFNFLCDHFFFLIVIILLQSILICGSIQISNNMAGSSENLHGFH